MNTDVRSESLVITASGSDEAGLFHRLASRITECGCNIDESRVSVLGGQFSLIMLVSGPWNALSKLESQLEMLISQQAYTLAFKRFTRRLLTPAAVPYTVDVVSMDRPGIVRDLSAFFSRSGINIEELHISLYPAPHTATTMCAITMTVGVQADVHIATLRGHFLDYCDELNLDATFEPVR